jgi:hypothetical protein
MAVAFINYSYATTLNITTLSMLELNHECYYTESR